MWLAKRTTRNAELLDNFHDLVKCTNILCSYSVSGPSANEYLFHYIRYRKSSKKLFPGVSTRPKPSLCYHNADLMKFWGPLPNGQWVSVWTTQWHSTGKSRRTGIYVSCLLIPFEFFWDLISALKQGKWTSRCCAKFVGVVAWQDLFQDCLNTQSPLTRALEVMFPDTARSRLESTGISPLLEAQHNSKGQKIPSAIYDLIRLHINSKHLATPFRHHKDLPHPFDALVLPASCCARHPCNAQRPQILNLRFSFG